MKKLTENLQLLGLCTLLTFAILGSTAVATDYINPKPVEKNYATVYVEWDYIGSLNPFTIRKTR